MPSILRPRFRPLTSVSHLVLPLAIFALFTSASDVLAQEKKTAAQKIEPEEVKLGRPVEFNRDIYPILENNCVACHNLAISESRLNLEDIDAGEIEPEAALFGEGLELDSIDALELALAIAQEYSIQLRAEDANIKEVFGSLRSLSDYIEANRA